MEMFSAGKHYLSQTDIEVDISSPYSLKKKVYTTHTLQF